MKRGWKHIGWCMALCFFGLSACKVERPSTVFSDEKMEAVLYDYHIAKALGDGLPSSEDYKRVLYVQSVFKKHGITEAQFDSSMVWLTRHPETLKGIYTKIGERLEAEKDKVDALIARRDNKPRESRAGDSIDVWAWQRVYALTGMPLSNRMTFSLPSDAHFQARDTLRWCIRFSFHGGLPVDTVNTPVMALQVRYETDSVLNAVCRIVYPGAQSLALWGDTLGRIERIDGFVYCPVQALGRKVLLDSISLMRYHARDSLSLAPDTVRQAVLQKKVDLKHASEDLKKAPSR